MVANKRREPVASSGGWMAKFAMVALIALMLGDGLIMSCHGAGGVTPTKLPTPAPQATKSVIYRLTMRDFMQAGCMTGTTYPATIDYYWPATPGFNTPITYNPRLISNPAPCPIRLDIIDQKYSGHPDFEPKSGVYADGCSGHASSLSNDNTLPNFTLATYGGETCTGSWLTRIVENDLEYGEDGLPKPIYCRNKFNPSNSTDRRCGWLSNQGARPTTSGKSSFDVWFRDDAKFNKRVSVNIVLEQDPSNPSLFVYDARKGKLSDEDHPLFRPLDHFTACQATDGRLDCSNGGKLWPPQTLDGGYSEATEGHRFLYTSELHTFFQFQGSETFQFRGDDDLWVFVNGHLAVDVGGLHSAQRAKINFANPSVRERLGLVPGQYYSLDIFHAERHTVGSNFRIDTSLASGCNILDAGKPAYTLESNTTGEWKIISGPTWGGWEGTSLRLTKKNVLNTVTYAFLQNQVNVGGGFIISFNFTATAGGEGFAFVLQRDSITNLGGGSGGNLGFRNIKGSLAIAFDFCRDRDEAIVSCNSRDVRLHYADNPDGFNSPKDATKRRRAALMHPNELNDGQTHTVELRYYDRSPNWLEVYIDGDLFLQHRDFNIESIIGGRNAWIGFTSATGQSSVATSDITITAFEVSTIAIEDRHSTSIGLPRASPDTALANGRQATAFLIQTFDFCSNRIEFGGFGDRAHGVLTRIQDEVGGEDRRRRLQGESDSNTIVARVVDLRNGIYSLNFTSTSIGNYSLQMWFGEGCVVDGEYVPQSSPTCFYESFENVASFLPVPIVEEPSAEDPPSVPTSALVGIGVASGIIFACGSMLIFVGIRIRNKWRKDKAFIEAGKLAAAEKGVAYTGDEDLDILQNKLQATLHAIQQERARQRKDEDQQGTIDALLRQKGELQEMVRRMKIMRDGGDPDAKQAGVLGAGAARVRKSFAASRVSRGFSLRLENRQSRGDSLLPEEKGVSAHNPLFSFPRFSVSRKSVAVPPPPGDAA